MMSKQIGKFRQWTSEKLGAQEQRTQLPDELLHLQGEMEIRAQRTDRMAKAFQVFIRSMSKRKDTQDVSDKALPIDLLGQSMSMYGEALIKGNGGSDDHYDNSALAQCLVKFGVASQKIARAQESYVDKSNDSLGEGLEKAIGQFDDLQIARKKLDSRRLGYDAVLSKVQNSKREDPRLEEEVRNQRLKFEESAEDVLLKMERIQDNEIQLMSMLTEFMDAQLEYHERSHDILETLKAHWPAERAGSTPPRAERRIPPSTNSRGSISTLGASSPGRRARSNSHFGSSSSSSPPPPALPSRRVSRTNSSSAASLSTTSGGVPHFDDDRKIVIANYTFQAEHKEELSFVRGDYIAVESEPEANGGWWIGQNMASQNSKGSFPSNYTSLVQESAAGVTANNHSNHSSDHLTILGSRAATNARPPPPRRFASTCSEEDEAAPRPDVWPPPLRKTASSTTTSASSSSFTSSPQPQAAAINSAVAAVINNTNTNTNKRIPPPPPVSRGTSSSTLSTKKAPPPPPLKRADLSSTNVSG